MVEPIDWCEPSCYIVREFIQRVSYGKFAAIFAIGNPVAFDANADDLDTLGFISITIILPLSWLTAN